MKHTLSIVDKTHHLNAGSAAVSLPLHTTPAEIHSGHTSVGVVWRCEIHYPCQ